MGRRKGMVQLSDPAKLQPIIDEVLDNNAQSIEDFKNGKRSRSWLLSREHHETDPR